MKPFFFVLFALLAIISTATAEETAVPTAIVEETVYMEMVVSGFESGEFAVKGIILEQINEVVVPRIKKALPDSTWTVYILVIGSADSVGAPTKNDRLSKDRAEAVAAELASNFPGVKPDVSPHGDEANRRQVVVKYKFVKHFKAESFTAFFKDGKIYPDSLSANKKETSAIKAVMALPIWAITIIVIIVLGVPTGLLFVIVRLITSKRKPAVPEEVPWEMKIISLDITTKSGNRYSVEVEHKKRIVRGKEEEVFVSPFVAKQGGEITRDSLVKILSSIRGSIEDKNGEFGAQFDALVKSGKITKR